MSRKLSKKRTGRKPTKKSFFQKLFTFPKIALYSFLVLGLFTFYQVTLPSKDVQGATSWEEGAMFSREEAEAEALKNKAAGIPIDKYVEVSLWKDANGNGEQDNFEDCLKKEFTVKLNGKTKTPTQKNCDGAAKYLKVTKNCNTIEFIKTNTSNKYKFTGMYVRDQKRPHGKNITDKKKVELCGFPEATGGDGWGFVYNIVEFGVKQQ